MIKSRLIDVLKALNKSEMKDLGDFIDSPFYNKNKSLKKLFRELKAFYPKFDNKKLTKEFIYSRLIPGKSYSDKTFRNLTSDLLDLTEKYLAVSLFHENSFIDKYFRISSSIKKSLHNLTESNIKDAALIFENSKFDGGNNLYFMHLIEMEKDFLSISKNKLINLNMKEGEYLIFSFISKYLNFKMKYFNYVYKLDTEKLSPFINEFESCINIDKFMNYLETVSEPFKEIILIYYYCNKFMQDLTADNYYDKVKSLIKKNKEAIITTEVINIYLTLSAFCTVKIRSGESRYERELLNLYKEMLENKLIADENELYLHITLFNNIVSLGLKTGELDWTKFFIEKYTNELMPEYRETMYNYSYSNYYFMLKDYEKSLEHINKVNFENYYIKSGVRILLLKIYYELKYTESFFSLSESFKHYLKNDKLLPEDKKISYGNFVTLANKLYKSRLEPEKYDIKQIVSSINNELTGMQQNWLMDKVNELI